MKKFTNVLKSVLFELAYIMMLSLVAFGISLINVFALKIVLFILNIVAFSVAMFFWYMQKGATEYDNRRKNNLKRKVMIETEQYIEIDSSKEYKKYKGFLIGGINVGLMLLLCIINLIIVETGSTSTVVSGIIKGLYYGFYGILFTISESVSIYIAIYGVVLMALVVSFAYIFGAKREKKNKEDKIETIKNQVYGDKKN